MDNILKVKIVSKSEIKEPNGKKKYCVFYIIDENGIKHICRKRALYDGFIVGKDIKLIVNTKHLVTGIVGFEILEKEIDESQSKEHPPVNRTELELYNKLKREGWDITRRGWADFACFKGDEFIAVEVKPKRNHRLKKRQSQVMKALTQHGIKCYRWSPDIGFSEVVLGKETL